MRIKRGARVLLPVAAAALLVAALAPLAISHFHDAAWRVPPEDRLFVERALADGADAFNDSPDEYGRITRPRVRHLADRVCVDLMTAHSGGDGGYYACYDGRGRLVSERMLGCSFGASRISDRLRALVW